MKTTIILIIAIALFFYTCKTKISFYPFKISMEAPYLFLGWISIGLGIVFISLHYDKIGYKRGVVDARNTIIEIINENKKDENK